MAITTAVHDAVLIFLVQSVVALVIEHLYSSVQIFVGNLNGGGGERQRGRHRKTPSR